ncbi:hypothetical protein [Thermoplasma volcanium GSS1]|uniref:7-carboxy-7-deazaguanine synthase n=1 Tax=Thermoplasma volcanium (strain ATCC 51530 / DSM 4299 / JCM 9571 / NBRC 15438 / GSS1) TaxID=273116 RepID=Q97C06_THEVO|nr:7-carboxy-7-deazaguanine synthase QueE [Thermoplasma volcanium]BAB59441.1 hypothetical protein [Thermoplasma volcanium GSS1]
MLITEIFHSIQGEGTLIGIPMLFVRTNVCNIRCEWCDTKYSFYGGREIALSDILNIVKEAKEQWVCFTGGEPLVQRDALSFVEGSLKLGKKILIETNGTVPIRNFTISDNIVLDVDVKSPSAKVRKPFLEENLKYIRDTDYLKIVIKDREDLDFAINFIRGHRKNLNYVLQPAWGSDIRMIADAIVETDLNVRVLPQLHKIMYGEMRGV